MTKKNKKDNKDLKSFSSLVRAYIKVKYPFLILLLISFLAATFINFINVSTAETVADFVLSDYEVGQISDKTIVARKTIVGNEANSVKITEGEKIIKKGFPITEESYSKLELMAASPLYIDYRAFANGELFLLLLAITWYLMFFFLPFHRKIEFKECLLHTIFFLTVYSIAAFGVKISSLSGDFSICILIPSSLCVMLLTILYGNLSAVLLSFLLSFGILQVTSWNVLTFLFVLSSSLSSTAIVRKITKRLDLVYSSILLTVLNIVFAVVYIVMFNRDFSDSGKLFLGLGINGFISGILTLGLITPIETVLNTASVFRLMDLSDVNVPLLQKMRINAPGTYQHSMMVAQLAEDACRAIGANSLLARVGGYYHDIGKIDISEYFAENQHGSNKHDDLNPTLSLSVIKSHVKKGVEMAYNMHLPNVIIDIIAEHHGNTVVQYFYNEAVQKDPTLTPEDFSYNGNTPTSKESAVIMLADTVEAACRTLENPSVSRLEKFITTLINGKIEHGQLDSCGLTYCDVAKVKETFVQIQAAFHHSRVEYPDQVDPDTGEKIIVKTGDANPSSAPVAAQTKSPTGSRRISKTAVEKALKDESAKTEKTKSKTKSVD